MYSLYIVQKMDAYWEGCLFHVSSPKLNELLLMAFGIGG
jgi:hypothetical protein